MQITWELFKLIGLTSRIKEASASELSADIIRMLSSAPTSYEVNATSIVVENTQRRVYRKINKEMLILKLQKYVE